MVFDHPGAFLAQERTDDLGGEAVVVLRRQAVADVVQQDRDDPVDMAPSRIAAWHLAVHAPAA